MWSAGVPFEELLQDKAFQNDSMVKSQDETSQKYLVADRIKKRGGTKRKYNDIMLSGDK